ncbi:hypothetical protein [Pedobacter psychroterrae]|uniref:Lipoprotein n=1 Tax=Pedobacter psychroterrae TaxID=2530453 RepID=A0A4R0NRN6_9SPHI|nr:hypothetical protein [Pedobacter psychroterrae]TCD02718.1 hypothetical protein EZ437_01640 [Pedobacter psychroterrae]
MKPLYLLTIILLSSCSLFKKTTKSSATSSFDLSKQIEENQLALTTTQKETKIYSLWKDSVFYQYQLIKEQVDNAKAGTVKTQENQQTKQEQTTKESKPVETWIYAGIILGLIGFILIFKKLNL